MAMGAREIQFMVRLETKTGRGEVQTTKLVTINRPVQCVTLAEVGLGLSEAKLDFGHHAAWQMA